MKEFAFLTIFAMETGITDFLSYYSNCFFEEKMFLQNINLTDMYYTTKRFGWLDKVLDEKKCCNFTNVHFEKKGPKV